MDPLLHGKGWIAGDLIYTVNCMLLENQSMYLRKLCLEVMQVFGIDKYCVQDTEKIWTHEKEASSSCVAVI